MPSGAVLDLVGEAVDGVVVTGGGCATISGTTHSLTVAVGGTGHPDWRLSRSRSSTTEGT